ncbi:MAG TPA: DUF4870 domain-containing protein [Fimbriimonadaceae bacterium]|nr:DUF4870 domain-containing protein [Fimbriimonadaceae bacterium]HRJ96582.1 DUF4870 domain-containing protein [Fimbriimonadaceae bacterium]
MSRWVVASTTTEERTAAAATHVFSIFFPIAAPAIAYCVMRRRSRFVAVHALQALFEAIVVSVVLFLAMGVSIVFTLVKVWELIQTRGQSFRWDLVWAAVAKALATWIILGLISLYYTIVSILQAIRAARGEYRPSLISGRLASRFVGCYTPRRR